MLILDILYLQECKIFAKMSVVTSSMNKKLAHVVQSVLCAEQKVFVGSMSSMILEHLALILFSTYECINQRIFKNMLNSLLVTLLPVLGT